MSGIICPFISSGNSYSQCHPLCKCLNDDGSCSIIKFFDNVDKIANSKNK